MNIKHSMYALLCLSLLYSQSISLAKANNQCEGFGIETEQSKNPLGVKITKMTLGCAAHNLGLHEGDIIVSVNDNQPEAEGMSKLLAKMIPTFAYTLKVVEENGSQQVFSNTQSSTITRVQIPISQMLDVSEVLIDNQVEADLQPTQQTKKPIKAEEPIYANVKEVGNNGLKWIKWLLFFVVLSFTLTPLLIIFASNGNNVAFYLGGAAILGAANADRNIIKGAVENVKFALIIYFILLLLGPIGTLYCLYRPLLAFISDADKTYCCAMTWLGGTDIAKKTISADGRWLAEIRETQNNYLGLGDKEFEETNTLSVMDLTTGQHVKWPQSGQILIGVNTDYGQVNKIKINDGIYIQPVDYLSHEETWHKLDFVDEILKPLNSERILPTPVQFVLLSSEAKYGQVELQEVNSGEFITINSNLDFNAHYISYDGRVLALVKANPKENRNDGLVRQLANLISNFLFEHWTIEFWDVAANKIIANYSGHGVNSDAWDKNDGVLESIGQTKFLESSQDGRLWYMIKSDGYIHVFDMRNNIAAVAHH